jgi:Flp pilus assembly protein TadG
MKRLHETKAPKGKPTAARSWRDTRGAISVEYLIGFLPVMFLFGTAWQTAHLYAGQLITQRAASAAGRAASVVLPDDPAFYEGAPIDSYSGLRERQIVRAAEIVLSASPRMLDQTQVRVEIADTTVTATVTSAYRCYPSFGFLVCGFDGVRTLTAAARYPYHRASFTYQ